MIPPLDFGLQMAHERIARLHREAATARLVAEARRKARAMRRGLSGRRGVTIRLDRAGDASRLYQLAALCEQEVAPGPFVVAEVDGRVLAALPLGDGPVIHDPSKETAHLRPLLDSRAAEARARTPRHAAPHDTRPQRASVAAGRA